MLDWIELPNGLHRLFCGSVNCKSDSRGVEVNTRLGEDVNAAYAKLVERHERKQEGTPPGSGLL
jgi:hypothetical protein